MFRMWMEDGKLKPIIEKTYSFDQYHEAYEHLSSGRAKGKLLIKIN
jgi:NADPH:quinone reductase-like Zn-dependent oxidoreductase